MGIIEDLIEKRKRVYSTKPELDQQFVKMSALKILKDKGEMGRIRDRPWLLIELCFTVVDKNKKTKPFFFNEVQKEFINALERYGSSKPYYVLKGRQQGFTTLITAIQLCYAITRKNFAGFTVADCNDNVNAIFADKAKTVYNSLPDCLKPREKYNSKRELYFDKLNSSWRIGSATDKLGRSRTLAFTHFSEVAFFECPISELQKSIGEALTKDAIIVYETTANGYNEAKELWDSGTCINLFFEWWKSKEYVEENTSLIQEVKDKQLLSKISFLRERGLTEKQIAWYVRKYNSYLDKNSLYQEYPCTPEEAFIASGDCEFDKDKLIERIARVKGEEPPIKGDFFQRKISNGINSSIVDINFQKSSYGDVKLYALPEEGVEYTIGVDTAGTGSDYFTAVVENAFNGRTVGVMQINLIDEDLFAHKLYSLGNFYNNALIAVEINFSTSVIRELAEIGYPKLYTRGEGMDMLGFRTTQITRPLIISNLKACFRDDPTIEVDLSILYEMLSFVRKNGRAEAEVGKHDDLVMAKAIARYVSTEMGYSYFERKMEGDFISNSFPELKEKKYKWEDL